jgi:hypothetical protein
MARVDLTVQVTTRAGIIPSYEAVAAASDAMCANDGATLFHIKAAAGEATLAFITPATVLSEALAIADAAGTVANGSEKLFGPFPPAIFNQPSGADVGKIYIDTNVAISIAAVRLGSAT